MGTTTSPNPPTHQARGQPETSGLDEISAHIRHDTATREDAHGTLTRLPSHNIDQDTLINALHVATDAGPFALETLDQPRRGLVSDRATLDDRLAAIDPTTSYTKSKESSARCATTARPSTT